MKLFTEIETQNPIKYIYSWKSQERLWKEKDRSWYVVYSFFFTVLIALLALIGEWVLILAIIGFAFLWFVQASVEPPVVEHIVSSVGIKTFGKLYKWSDIKCFWFSTKTDALILNLDLINEENPDAIFKRRISLVLNTEDKIHLFEILFNYIEYGDQEDIGVNILTQMIYGKYVDIEEFMSTEQNLEEAIEKAKDIATKKEKHL
jgi:hypothetical protein